MTDTATPVPEPPFKTDMIGVCWQCGGRLLAGHNCNGLVPHHAGVSSVSTEPPAENPGELLPCAHCGSVAQMHQVPLPPADEEPSEYAGGYYIECANRGCSATTSIHFSCGDDCRPELVAKWNRRAPLTRGVPESSTLSSPECSGSDKPNAVSPVPDELVRRATLIEELRVEAALLPHRRGRMCAEAADALEAQRRKIEELRFAKSDQSLLLDAEGEIERLRAKLTQAEAVVVAAEKMKAELLNWCTEIDLMPDETAIVLREFGQALSAYREKK